MSENKSSKFVRAGVLLAIALTATPALSANADNGRVIALRWCQACHVVSSTQTRATGEAPPFEEISKRPGFDPTKLTNFLFDPHPKMPDMSLTRDEAADLAAYIASLSK